MCGGDPDEEVLELSLSQGCHHIAIVRKKASATATRGEKCEQ